MFHIEVPPGAVQDHYAALAPLIQKKLNKEISSPEFQNFAPGFQNLLLWIAGQNQPAESNQIADQNQTAASNQVAGQDRTASPNHSSGHLQEILTGDPRSLMALYDFMQQQFQFQIRGKDFFTDQGIHEEEIITESRTGEKGRTEKTGKKTCPYTDCLKRIFNYEDFQSKGKGYHAYSLTSRLNLHACPYCNRQFTMTVMEAATDRNQEKVRTAEQGDPGIRFITRPELDHYFPQSRYPMFALSFYNLIPSCHICNSNIKGQRELDLNLHYHPYIPEDKDFRFRMTLTDAEHTAIALDYRNLEKAEETCSFFQLPAIYAQHTEETDRLLDLYRTFDPDTVRDLCRDLYAKGITLPRQSILDLIYAHYIVTDPEKEVLGKLKDDLYRQIRELY